MTQQMNTTKATERAWEALDAPLPRTALWEERERRSVAELLHVVPAGGRVAVVDLRRKSSA